MEGMAKTLVNEHGTLCFAYPMGLLQHAHLRYGSTIIRQAGDTGRSSLWGRHVLRPTAKPV